MKIQSGLFFFAFMDSSYFYWVYEGKVKSSLVNNRCDSGDKQL